MPIRVKCTCGKALSIPDAASGKVVKCPGCQKSLRIPGGASAAPTKTAPAKSAPPKPAPEPVPSGIEDLLAEEGMNQIVEAVCPACRTEMKADAVLCVKCGYHKESGMQFDSHKTAGVDIDHGTLALQKAAEDMLQAKQMQEKMLKGPGMPWWALALVLFLLGSGLTIAVLAVNASRRVDQDFDVNPLGLFMLLAGVAFGLVAVGAYLMILVHAVQQTGKMGLLAILPPYAIYYVFVNLRETWTYLAGVVVMGTISAVLITLVLIGTVFGALMAQASAQAIL